MLKVTPNNKNISQQTSYQNKAHDPLSQVKQFVNNLACKLLAAQSSEPSSYVFSAYSLSQIAALTLQGIDQKTQEIAMQSLGLNNIQPDKLPDLINQIGQSAGSSLKSHNAIVAATRASDSQLVSQASQQENVDISYYGTYEEAKDAANNLNSWVLKHTENALKGEFTADALFNACITLVNASYFEGAWKYPLTDSIFKTENVFTTLNGKTIPAQVMCLEDEYLPCFDSEKMMTVELPYKNDKNPNKNMSYFILMPKDPKDFQNLEKTLSPDQINALRKEASKEKINLTIPKYTLDSKIEFPILKDALEKSGFPTDAILNGHAKISDMKQSTLLNQDNLGTQAASVTSTDMCDSVSSSKDVFIEGPHFGFLILNDTIIFAGAFKSEKGLQLPLLNY